jgi:DNA invertase Pin-like site-specific DNA recombinase/predicted metal-binding protein
MERITTSTTHFILYARKSSESEDRQVLSIDSQVDELRQIAVRTGLALVAVKTEAYSAKAPGRPVFNEVFNDIEAGKVQGLIVWNPDRLSRNSVDTGRLIYLFDIGKLYEVVTPSQVFRNTPNDKFLLNLLCSQAKLENDNKGINVKRGLKAKAERGIYPAPAPLGYLNDRYAERGNKTIKPDPERFALVRKLFDLLLTGTYTVMQIRKIANDEWGFRTPNGKQLGRSNLYYIFSRPFYYGLFEYPVGSGNWYKGIHQPMITAEEYDRAQILLGRKGRPRPKKHIFEFTGMIRCGECGGTVTAEEKIKHQQNGNLHRYVYYHCTKRKHPACTQGSLEEKALKRQIVEVIDSLRIPPEFHDWAMTWFRQHHDKEAVDRTAILASQQKAYNLCVRKTEALVDLRLGGEITQEEFAQRKASLVREKARLEELLHDTGHRVNHWLETAEELLTFAEQAKEKFNTGTCETRRHILSTLGSNLLLTDKTLHIDVENALFPMQRVVKDVQAIHERLEPLKLPINTDEIERCYARRPSVLRGLDDVRITLQRITGYSPFAIVRSW